MLGASASAEASGRQTMIFDTTSRVVADPDAATRTYWGA